MTEQSERYNSSGVDSRQIGADRVLTILFLGLAFINILIFSTVD